MRMIWLKKSCHQWKTDLLWIRSWVAHDDAFLLNDSSQRQTAIYHGSDCHQASIIASPDSCKDFIKRAYLRLHYALISRSNNLFKRCQHQHKQQRWNKHRKWVCAPMSSIKLLKFSEEHQTSRKCACTLSCGVSIARIKTLSNG